MFSFFLTSLLSVLFSGEAVAPGRVEVGGINDCSLMLRIDSRFVETARSQVVTDWIINAIMDDGKNNGPGHPFPAVKKVMWLPFLQCYLIQVDKEWLLTRQLHPRPLAAPPHRAEEGAPVPASPPPQRGAGADGGLSVKPDEHAETQELVFGMHFLRELLRLAGPDASFAIVRFNTAVMRGYVPGGTNNSKKSVALPDTYVTLGKKDENDYRWQLHVKGTFSIVKELRGHFPPLGDVAQDVWLDPFGRGVYGADRLRPLFEIKAPQRPLILLAVMPHKAKSILDSTLLGPLSTKDAKHLEEVARLLAKEPLSEMPRQRAERLLDAANPLLVVIGLLRLEELKALSAKDFGRAIDALPTANATVVIGDMLDWPLLNAGSRDGVTKELSDFFRAGPPKRQQALLKVVNDVLGRNPQLVARIVNLADLQAAARKYRATIVNDPARREVLRELDALLKLREKK